MDSARDCNVVSKEKHEETKVSNDQKEYLSIELPADCRKVKMVVMECESHDQGWSSYPGDQGTLGLLNLNLALANNVWYP